jgi:cytidylate kinase
MKSESFFRHQVSITSLSGCGSSALLKALKQYYEKSPYRFASGGDIMRTIARRRNVPIETLAEQNRLHPEWEIDYEMDQMLNLFGTQDFLICEGRLPHILLPGAYKVRLGCPREECARRIAARDGITYEESLRRVIKRDKEDDEPRYKNLYGEKCLWDDDTGFDLVIDTQANDQIATVEKFIAGHAKWVEQKEKSGLIVNGILCMSFLREVKTLRYD